MKSAGNLPRMFRRKGKYLGFTLPHERDMSNTFTLHCPSIYFRNTTDNIDALRLWIHHDGMNRQTLDKI